MNAQQTCKNTQKQKELKGTHSWLKSTKDNEETDTKVFKNYSKENNLS